MRNNSQSFLPKFIFLCIITTSIVTTLTLSKYQSTMAGSSNSARVSRPVLSVKLAENQEQSLTIDCNTDTTSVNYGIVVSNKENDVISEVSLKYDIIITLPTQIPDGFKVKVDDKYATQNKNVYTIENVGTFSSSVQSEKNHTLTFEADPNIVRNTSLKDVIITVYAEQID